MARRAFQPITERVNELLNPMGEWLEESSNQSQDEFLHDSRQYSRRMVGWALQPITERVFELRKPMGQWLEESSNQSQNKF